jgi:hypothetical protein
MDQYNFSLENHVTILFATYGFLHFITDFVNLFSNFKRKKVETTKVEEIETKKEIEISESESGSESDSDTLLIINDISDSEPEYDQAYYIRKRRKLI